MTLNPTLSVELTLLRDSALRWSAAHREQSPERWRSMAELGWLSLPLPEEAGGLGQGLAEACILAQALGHAPISEHYASFVIEASSLVVETGNPCQRTTWIPGMLDGSLRVAPAHLEANSSHGPQTLNTRALRLKDGWQISGHKRPVCGDATHFLLSADSDQGMVFFVIARDTQGLTVKEVSAVDGGRVASLSLNDVKVDDSAWLRAASSEALSRAHDCASVVACAEEVGSMQAALKATVEYCRTRQQFGQALAANQVIRHRLANMSIACREAQAMLQGAVLEVEEAQQVFLHGRHGGVEQRSASIARAASLARGKISKLAMNVLEEAIQLHGGMGVTDELSIAHYLRRHLALDALFGHSEWHFDRYARLPHRRSAAATGIGADTELASFRTEVREFLARSLSEDVKRATRLNTSVFSEPEVSLPWQRKLYAQGWVAPAWPKEYGGTGWSLARRWIFETELAQAGAPSLSPLGLRMAGPVIMKFGSPEQKAHYLPRLLAGDDYWCQGYSEPGSGSDLASLKMRAEATVSADGALMYRINGSKIWTSHAHHANRMFALVRTGVIEGRKQEGISFLLIDMALPGITVRPIMSASGDHEVNQVFFDDVMVPVTCRLGEEGQGWKIAKYLLEFERGGAISSGQLRASLGDSLKLAHTKMPDGAVKTHEALIEIAPSDALDIASIEADIRALEMMELAIMSTLTVGQNPGAVSSMLKLRWSEIHQDITRLNLKLLGPDVLFWERARPLHLQQDEAVLGEVARPVSAGYLNARAFTIFGGTSEIQREIIARELLS
jgi:alkylation response protein AidB-like acyl-CoA dehydrogenase